ncbi:MAG: hydroxyphenylacetyl-CoA thioesterase PaaI [Candidatus Methanomethylicota archaeon]|uniref:Hydroxyphenylacetyl-CoA thioesterase PaaI n=1 Tax=Thermoproteota archaeon TaxID=2056631 RepID=A0A497EP17_9CREN|nr:MAG: hydroxyphenylacetyl-CoA thioesterase PaaI [Candidatus Verstraetearchaeota archaeon]
MSLEKLIEKFKQDPFSRMLGIDILEVREGFCKASMVIKEEHLNFHGIAHGGAILALADAAFAAASNSRNKVAVALSINVNYRRPVKAGTRLYAEAFEESLGKTTGLYRMKVITEDGKLVAVCDGLVYTFDEPVLK